MNENTPENDAPQNDRLEPGSNSVPKRSEVYDWIQCVVVALVFCVLIFSFFVRLVDVIGSSMYPTLENADKMLVSDLFYTPHQGDIIVFQKKSFMEEPLVKRIIAVAGQTVDIDFDTGTVYVDGKAIDEPYIAEPTTTRLDFYGPVTVPDGCVFVMGDNRNHSNDSRDERVGFVDVRTIIGKVYMTVYPLKHFGSVYSG